MPSPVVSAPTVQADVLSDHPLLLAAYLDARQRAGGATYAVAIEGDDLRAVNAKHTFSTVFGSNEVRIVGDGDATRIRLRLVGFGRGTVQPAPTVSTREATGQRVIYKRGTLSEWYMNGPLGLEQTFELSRRPAGDSGDVVLALAVAGNVTPQLSAGGDRVLLQTSNGVRYAYRDLVVYDASGRRLPAHMTVADRRVALHFDDRGAHYPVVVDPFIVVEEQKLTASDAAVDDEFGLAVAVSGDTAVIGAYGDDDGASGAGSAYVFVRSGTTWTLQQKLTAGDAAAGDAFGRTVAVSGDTAVIGARYDDDAGSSSGSAYVFVRSGTTWTQQQKLTASDAAAVDNFGGAVAVSGDTAVIGAHFDDDAGTSSGSAYVFVRSGTTWTQQQKLTASDAAAEDIFGASLAVSGDTAVISAWNNDDGGSASGSAYVFVRSGTTWTQQQKLTASDAAGGDRFGYSVAVSGDTAVIGARYDDDAGSDSGSAYVFVRSVTIWTQQQKLTANDAAAGDEFGVSVAVSGDTVGVGALEGGAGSASGSAYVFVRNGTAWGEQQKITASDAEAGDQFGVAVALSGDTAVIGARYDNDAGSNSGSAYMVRIGQDEDFDGLVNTADNCPFVANATQTDADGDGLGDACDSSDGLDVDGDGVANTTDNCPFVVNATQTDSDADGLGDACDTADGLDVDDDGVVNTADNCPFAANGTQTDSDGDGTGDVCDSSDGLDVDEDGVANTTDNCPFDANGTQTDTDGDGTGDVCDSSDGLDVDGDGVVNTADNCPFAANGTQTDTDGDGTGDVCDSSDGLDVDGDGVVNTADNCPFAANATQTDTDGDGTGDACDSSDGLDVDGDGVVNTADNCPFTANAGQEDADSDGLGDVCDDVDGGGDDVDGDGVVNDDDNCPFTANADQADADDDGRGDACDGLDGLDVDGDGIANPDDNCPFTVNADQADGDGDGRGDACDDIDNGVFVNGDGGCGIAGNQGTTWSWLLLCLIIGVARRRRTRTRLGVFCAITALLALGCGRGALEAPSPTESRAPSSKRADALREHPRLLAAYLDARQRAGGAAYAVATDGQQWRATNEAHTFSTVFGAGGVRIAGHAKGTRFGLQLAGLGRGTVKAVPPVTKRVATGQRVTYHRDGLTEWYMNGPLGLEQTFELSRRPEGAAGEVVLALAVTGNVTPHMAPGGDRMWLQAAGGARYSYRDLVVYDATGQRLPARMTVEDRRVALRFDDRGARYPVVVDPFIAIEEQKLTASDAAAGDGFGFAVAVSGDTAVVGAIRAGGSGAAYVFVRSGTTWAQQQKLTSDAAASGFFGYSVAVSGDTAVISAMHDDAGAGAQSGSAYVFVRSGTTWTQQQKLTASDAAASDRFGYSVAVSGDTAVIGARYDADAGSFSGSAYVFVRSGTSWTQQQKLTASDAAAADYFGVSVAVSGDTTVIGSYGDDDDGSESGAAYVFVRGGTTWTQQQKLTANDAAIGDQFGRAVAVSGDTAVMGAPYDDAAAGSAYVFMRSGTTWTQQQKLSAGDGAADDYFGIGVAISGDTLVVGALQDDDAGIGSGSAYVFVRSGTTWTQRQKLTASDAAAGDVFGCAVAISGDTAVIGAYRNDEGGNDSGSAYVFRVGQDEDFDGLPNTVDSCPFVANATQSDTDGDGIGDACDGVDDLDLDGDGVVNTADNCPFVANATQADADSDDLGDACDPSDGLDVDGDGVVNTADNCPFAANGTQTDSDGDGTGDACDSSDGLDVDGDGVVNTADNCPFDANGTQTDSDGDGTGDVCDSSDGLDVDGDGVVNTGDNCPFVANATQTDSDGDGTGDACDSSDGLDVDGDGVVNTADNCPFDANATQTDADGDGTGDACDSFDDLDVDGDGVANTTDNCAFVANPGQEDADGDGLGDLCDGTDGPNDDVDGDGVANTTDNCPFVANADQADADGDDLGDVCDSADDLDVDGDGIANTIDNCPFTANADQADADEDGFGDACDDIDNGAGGEVYVDGGCGVAGGHPGTAWALLLLCLAVALSRRRRKPRVAGDLSKTAEGGGTKMKQTVATHLCLGILLTVMVSPAVGCGRQALEAPAPSETRTQSTKRADGLRDHPRLLAAYLDARQRAGGPAYDVATGGDEWRAANQVHTFSAIFASDSVSIEGEQPATRFGLRLLGLGRSTVKPVVAVSNRTATGQRVTYHRGDLTEWYMNGPLGLEQTFELDRRPVGTAGEVVLALAVTGNVTPQLSPAGDRVWLQAAGGARYSYRDLVVYDAAGRRLPARMTVADRRVALHFDDRGARYPVVVDPFIAIEEQKLTASDAAANDQFGYSVAVAGDTAVIGAPFDDDAGSASGAAYVFVRTGTTWTQQQKLTAGDASTGAAFGYSVALAGDTAILGAYSSDDAGSESGSAYVFVRNGTTWTQQQKLTATDAAAGDRFGYSVSVSGDTAVIGAHLDDDAGSSSGSAYVFVRSGSTWTQQQKLTATDAAAGDTFGRAVAVSGDTAVIGAHFDDDAGTDSGSAYVFVHSGTTWTEQQKLTASDAAANDDFGFSVAVSGDTVVIGARFDDDAGTDSGSAYVFVRSGATWTQQQKLTASDAADGDRFGYAVTVAGDTAVIGAPLDDEVSAWTGSAYVFVRSGATWAQQQKLTASDAAADDWFGYAVAVSGDTAVVAANRDDDAGTSS